MSAFQTTNEFHSWRTSDDISGKKFPFPLSIKDVELADLQVGDVFITGYGYETHSGYHLHKVIKKNKKTITAQDCTSLGNPTRRLDKYRLLLQKWPYQVVDFYAQ